MATVKLRRPKPLIAYASSLIQQNHGETLKGHGWLDWSVKDRSFTFHELQNEYGYYTLTIENGKVPSTVDMPKNVRLRIFAGDMDPSGIKKLVTKLRTKHNISELAVNRFGSQGKSVVSSGPTTNFLDIHNVDYQNKLIAEFLHESQPNIAQETLDGVIQINKEMNDAITSDDPTRRLVWKPLSMKFDNLFTYGKGNSLNFDTMNGVMGLFSPNATGKSSIPDAICFALYDRTPRTTKAANIMNTRATDCFIEFVFEIAGTKYIIERRGKKNKKGEVKIDVDFWRVEVNGDKTSLNGEERRYTNHVIRNYVGDYEDFILTALSAQTQNGLFVDRGQSDRKDTLSQFMGLTIFDKLHTLANEKSKEVAGALKRFHNDDFTQELVDVQSAITTISDQITDKEAELESVNVILNDYAELVQEKYEQKVPVTIKHTDIRALESSKANAETQIANAGNQITEQSAELDKIRANLAKARVKLDTEFVGVEDDYANFQKLESEHRVLKTRIDAYTREIDSTQKQLERQRSNLKMNPECDVCVQVNIGATSLIADLELKVGELKESLEDTERCFLLTDTHLLTLNGVQEKWERLNRGKEYVTQTERKESELALAISKLETQRAQLMGKLDDLNRNIQEYHDSADILLKNADLDTEINNLEAEKRQYKTQFTAIQTDIRSLHSQKALKESKRDEMLKRIKEAEQLESTYEAYEAYLAAVCRDGLPYKLISEVLPQVQVEVNNILSQMVEFTVALETDGKNVNGKIVYDDERQWPIELASGMEKFVSGLAIRVALMSVSSLPKSNFLIIDEGLGALDADNLSSLFMLFDMLRSQFDFILLISHLDVVRDISDSLIEIKRSEGYSTVVYT